ncbi:hypothetical protein VTI28DRAFT_6659 [Corynascus sepedonium]
MSNNDSSPGRRWDDPPDAEPPSSLSASEPPPMVFLQAVSIPPTSSSELTHLTFSPGGTHVSGTVDKTKTMHTLTDIGPYTLATWSATTGRRVHNPPGGGQNISSSMSYSGGVTLNEGGFAFHPDPTELVVACPFLRPRPISAYDYRSPLMPRLEAYDLGPRAQRLLKWAPCPMRAPLAWGGAPDGTTWLAGVSVRDSSRLVIARVTMVGSSERRTKDSATVQVAPVMVRHDDEVTQLAFVRGPTDWMAAGMTAVVSAARDGYVRVTCADTGTTLKRIEVVPRVLAPRMMQVSPDGNLVVTVWGREVVLCYLDSGRVDRYHLDTVRARDGWPLCVSPDCRYLACSTEHGFDVSDVATGKLRGEFSWDRPPITSGAFNHDGTRLAISNHKGGLDIFHLITS